MIWSMIEAGKQGLLPSALKLLSTVTDVNHTSETARYTAEKELIRVMHQLAEPLSWFDMESAPKDGTPIVGLCVHKADPYWLDEKHLTIYGGHTEGLSHVQDGPHVIQWGGAYDDSTWESPGASMPDWWFQSGSDFEVTANPVGWLPIAAYKERL